ncbi:response regulator [Roseovarius sp. B08]|uniref:response regulator n=1 Tax=Roseovarius sp. B08 TaxID=3449223 RepID=UPI003EDC8B81
MGNNHRVVALVDDDERILESLANLFESAGFTTRPYQSASLFLQAGLSGVDCLVTDLSMPGIDGFELCKRVKHTRPHFPVFLVSGRHEADDVARMSCGATKFFRKPFDSQRLLMAVENIFFDK